MKDYTYLLDGLTRRPGLTRTCENPTPHSPHMIQNRIMLEKFTPESPDVPVQSVVQDGNLAVTWGLDRLVNLIVTGTAAWSNQTLGWVSALYVGTDSDPAFGYSDNALNSSIWSVNLGGGSMGISDKGDRTVEYQATIINTTSAFSVAEVGLFGSNTQAVALSTLAATDQVMKATGDTVNISYQLIFASAP